MNNGTFVVVHLVNPKEKYWGILRVLGAAGLTIRGIDVDLFDEWARQVRNLPEAELGLATLFVPMHRVEKVFEDARIGAVGSYQERFFDLVGRTVRDFIGDETGAGAGSPN
ncbi:MAG: hypothetical protein DIJKHBIC_02629 [Thermoanaerobaculia bacterium]|nr:hypothetical protein [Thermoanaerobaculia bacterium]